MLVSSTVPAPEVMPTSARGPAAAKVRRTYPRQDRRTGGGGVGDEPPAGKAKASPARPPRILGLVGGTVGSSADPEVSSAGAHDRRSRDAGKALEAASGVEPLMEVLQTSALPLGYAASARCPLKCKRQTTEHIASVLCLAPERGIGAGEGTRTLDLLHGKQTL